MPVTTRNTEGLPGGSGADDSPDVQGTEASETRARRLGWRPKEQFRGDPEMWVDADEFIRRGEEQMPLLRENLRKEQARNAALEKQMGGLSAEVTAMKEQVKESREISVRMSEMFERAEIQGFNRAQKELNAKFETAIEEGDVVAAKAARKELEELTDARAKIVPPKPAPKAAEPPKATEPPPTDPVADAWVKSDKQYWFNGETPAHKAARQFAIVMSGELAKNPDTKDMSLTENLAETRRLAMESFPGIFDREPADERTEDGDEPEPKPRAARVATPRSPSGNQRRTPGNEADRDFNDIPRDDRGQYDRLVRELKEAGAKKIPTKEQFAADYWGGDRPTQNSRV